MYLYDYVYRILNTHRKGVEMCHVLNLLSYTFGLSDGQVDEVTDDYWSGSCSASRSVMWGMGIDLCVTVCLTVGLPGSGRMCLCFHLCAAVCMCVCVRCTLASLGYPLQPVQETNKLHFNMRNINFLLDGKLIMAVEPPTPKPVQGTQCHCWEVKSATVTTSDQSTNRSGGIWFICPMSLAFCGFVKLNKKRYLSIQSMSMFQLCVEKIRKKVFSHCVELFFNSLH